MINNSNYEYEIHKYDSNKWNKILELFNDVTIYQTHSFSRHSVGGDRIEQFILKKDNAIVAISLVRIKTLPIINRGVAYLRWGPIWQRKNGDNNIATFNIALQKLEYEYSKKRKLVLRILSNQFKESNYNFSNIFKSTGYKRYRDEDKTIVVDLSQDEDILRNNLRKKWRYSLKQAEKNNLIVEKGTSEVFFNTFLELYKTLQERKNFDEYVDVESFRTINSELSDDLKMRIFLCKLNNKSIAAMVTSALGNGGIYLLGGTAQEGLNVAASYLLQWKTMMWLKSIGVRYYDLGGVDAIANPGVYRFKSGMGGEEKTFIGGFEICSDPISKLLIRIKERL